MEERLERIAASLELIAASLERLSYALDPAEQERRRTEMLEQLARDIEIEKNGY